MAYFAELDAAGVCIAVSEQPQCPPGDRFVPLDVLDATLLGLQRLPGEWVVPTPPPEGGGD